MLPEQTDVIELLFGEQCGHSLNIVVVERSSGRNRRARKINWLYQEG